MSLFPAYSESTVSVESNVHSETSEVSGTQSAAWLENASFNVKLSEIPLPSPLRADSESPKAISPPPTPREEERSSYRKRSKKHKKHKHKRRKTEEVTREEDYFYEDKTSARGNLNVKTLYRPAIPLYHARFSCLTWIGSSSNFSRKRRKKKRYYQQVLELPEKQEDVDNSSTVEDPKSSKVLHDFAPDNSLEEDLSKKTAEFNKMLADDPNDIMMWLKYVRFQDIMWQFERTYRRGGGARGLRVTAERKLSILDKALEHNPGADALLREHFLVAESIYPADVLSRQLSDMVDRQPSCVTLWRCFIQTTQCSLSLCSASPVLKLYEQGMGRLHQLRRGAPSATTRPMEDGILDLLLDCGLFLRQAGLWEQLWLLLKLYMELNLAQPDTELFKNFPSIPEEYIASLEERILSSQLPLPELWYRVERLRECAHWLPWSSESNCEDPQRLVFPDDVSDMLHPITTPGLNFRLVTIVLSLLKVPLLPSRDTSLRFVGLDQVPWCMESVEPLLTMFYPLGTVELQNKSLLSNVAGLVYGPQYLLNHLPGQEQYLEFVTKIFTSNSKCLSEPFRTALCVWWLRFERFLLVLDRLGHCNIPPARKKKIKSIVKDFLKKEENRNNSLFYLEYAQIEHALGQVETACKILRTAIVAQQGGMSVVSIACEHKKAGLCLLHRTLCELILKNDDGGDVKKALSVLVALGCGSSPEAEMREDMIAAAGDKFHHITTELVVHLDSSTEANGSEHLLPHFLVEWVTCHAWFLLLTLSPWEAAALFEKTLTRLSSSRTSLTVALCQREALFESYVSLLHHHCHSTCGSFSVLKEVLHRALQEFPNNMYCLSTVAAVETGMSCISSSWWKLTRYFNVENNSLIVPVFQVLMARQKQVHLEEACLQSHTYLNTGGPVIPCPSGKYRLSSLFKRFFKLSMTKRCPLLWRLYLQFLSEHGQEGLYHTAFYRAVEECPWIKVLYMEASKLLPTQLPQIQDLLMEKELRLHVTPEELDILRSDPPPT